VQHVVPVSHNTVVERIGNLQHVPQSARFVTDHDIFDLDVANFFLQRNCDAEKTEPQRHRKQKNAFTQKTKHHYLKSEDRATNHARKDGMGKVAVGKPTFHKPGAVIAHWKNEHVSEV
jgi:hypothetical protein